MTATPLDAVAAIALVFCLSVIAFLLLYIREQSQEQAFMVTVWRDAYHGEVAQHDATRAALTAQTIAHEELQREFLKQGRERVA